MNATATLQAFLLATMLLFFATLDSKRPPNWAYMRIGIPARWRFGTIIFCMAFVSSVTGLSADVWTRSQFTRCRNHDGNNAAQKHGRPPDQWGSLGEEDMWDTHGHRFLDVLGMEYAQAFESIAMHPGAASILFCKDFWPDANPVTDGTRQMNDAADELHSAFTALSDLQGSVTIRSVYRDATSDDVFSLIFDTGATISVTPHLSDFIEPPEQSEDSHLNGLSHTARIAGIGRVKWILTNDDGTTRELVTLAYHIPTSNVRLFAPIAYLKQLKNQDRQSNGRRSHKPNFHLEADKAIFSFGDGGTISFTYSSTLLPIADATRHHEALDELPQAHAGTPFLNPLADEGPIHQVIDIDNQNLTEARKELLRLHWKCGHIGFQNIQLLLREGVLETKVKRVASAQPPLCAACQLARMHRRGAGIKAESFLKGKHPMMLKSGDLIPGSTVSIDQYESPVRGRLPNTRGMESMNSRYVGGTIFADHASGYLGAYHQTSLNAIQTIRSKHLFEREARQNDRVVKQYQGDNGVFKSEEFQDDLREHNQVIHYSGTGAHHQNGAAERAVGISVERARVMLIHAAIHWPEQTNVNLWPFAMNYSVFIHNHTPNKDSHIAPVEIFTGTKLNPFVLRNARVFGCPTYVLDATLQDGHKIPKWRPRSRRGQFLGFSNEHATTIGIIRNIRTGYVTPQFHCVYDEWFTTVASDHELTEDDPIWTSLFLNSRDNYFQDDDMDDHMPDLHPSWLDEHDREQRIRTRRSHQTYAPRVVNPFPHQVLTDEHTQVDVIEEDIQDDDDMPPIEAADQSDSDSESEDEPEEHPVQQPRRGPPRKKKAYNPKFHGNEYINHASLHVGDSFLANMDHNSKSKGIESRTYQRLERLARDPITGTCDFLHPHAFAAKANDEDTPNLRQAMNGSDSDGFKQAMKLELDQLKDKGTWEIVKRQRAGSNSIIGTTWVFKRKRYPDGAIRKLKARVCARGDQMIKGVDYFETYSPVVSWSTVRVMMIISLVMGYETRQVDYTLAFCQASLDDPIYCRIPSMYDELTGSNTSGMILLLRRSLYGLTVAAKLFYETLKGALINLGFLPSENDPCLFIHHAKQITCLCYVDDCVWTGPSGKGIEDVIRELKKTLDLNYEDEVAGFLGILMQRSDNDDGTMTLLQTGLTDRILAMLQLTDGVSNGCHTPSETQELGSCPHSPPYDGPWSYRSVIGMMLYLSANTRPDIAYAVHQCARYSANPTEAHAKGLKRIGRYLQSTRDKGMIINPKTNLKLDCSVDANFAGLWNVEDANDPACVRSRTGYVITLGDIPVVWSSKLQTEISLSTMQAEYVALSTAMRDLIPMRRLMTELCDVYGIVRDEKSTMSTVWEDNNGALALANADLPKMTPQSKYFATKYHWFRQYIGASGGSVEVKRVCSKDQKADIFTKPLGPGKFPAARKMLLGW